MADINITITGLDEIRKRMQAYPTQWKAAVTKTMQGALLYIWETVGDYGYPKKRPESKYRRTGQLGRSLGISEQGGMQGTPSIYKVTTQGMDASGEFGTNLGYATYVIGEKQAWMHKSSWWTMGKTIFPKAKVKVERAFQVMGEELARWLDQ